MANLHFAVEKETKEKASAALRKHVKATCDLYHVVRFESDDGGNHLVLYLEVGEPSDPLDLYLKEALHTPIWMGWRFILLKVPYGYIDAMVTKAD